MNSEDKSRVELTELIMEHRVALYGFILAQVRNVQYAEDLFQDVCLVISEKWGEYDRTRPFRAWAFGIARHRVLKHFEKQVGSRLVFDDDLIEKVAAQPEWDEDTLPEREALRACLDKLTHRTRQMLTLRYYENLPPGTISEKIGGGARGISVALVRAKAALLECVETTLSRAEG